MIVNMSCQTLPALYLARDVDVTGFVERGEGPIWGTPTDFRNSLIECCIPLRGRWNSDLGFAERRASCAIGAQPVRW